MPDAAQKVDALSRRGQEGARRAGPAAFVGRDDDEEGVLRHRQEGLAALGVALDQVEVIGQDARLGVEDRDAGAPGPEIEPRPVVVALAEPVVDRPVIAGRVEDVAEPGAQGVIFVTEGEIWLSLDGQEHDLGPGGYAYIPAGCDWRLRNAKKAPARFHWVRKLYETAPGIARPAAFVTSDQDITPVAMPDTGGRWATTRFVEPDDLRHDMHVNVVTFQPGGVIPFEETHVMEHGLYVLEGKAVYKLNRDWVEVEAGDFMWLRAYCPQACYAAGPGRFRYLLYKDVNRHANLRGPGAFGR